MSELVKALLEFVILFIAILIIHKIVYKRKKDFSKLKPNDEVRTFVLKYDIDVRKIDYNLLLNVLAVINSFIISFTATIIVRIKSVVWTLVVCILIVLSLLIALYTLAGKYFKSHEKEITVESKIEEVVKESKKKKTKKKEGNKNV